MNPLVPSPAEAAVMIAAVIVGIAVLVVVVRWAVRGIVREHRSRQQYAAATDERDAASH